MNEQLKQAAQQFGLPGAVGAAVGGGAFTIPDDLFISGHNRPFVDWFAVAVVVISTVVIARVLHGNDDLRQLWQFAGTSAILLLVFLLVCMGLNTTVGRAFSPDGPIPTIGVRFIWQSSYVLMVGCVGPLAWVLWRVADVFRKKLNGG